MFVSCVFKGYNIKNDRKSKFSFSFFLYSRIYSVISR